MNGYRNKWVSRILRIFEDSRIPGFSGIWRGSSGEGKKGKEGLDYRFSCLRSEL
jgi:hypothetical protein